MQAFDLVLFKGDDFTGSALRALQKAKLGSNADFSHVGLVITSEIDDRLELGKAYILESTCSGPVADGVPNIHGHSFLGVQIRDLSAVIAACKGEVWRAALKQSWKSAYVHFNDPLYVAKYRDVVRSVEGIRYDANPVSLIGALFPVCRCCRQVSEKATGTEQWLFCSEMVAYVLKACDILPHSVRERDVVPSDFVPSVKDDDGNNLPKLYDTPVQVNRNST